MDSRSKLLRITECHLRSLLFDSPTPSPATTTRPINFLCKVAGVRAMLMVGLFTPLDLSS